LQPVVGKLALLPFVPFVTDLFPPADEDHARFNRSTRARKDAHRTLVLWDSCRLA
jgi:hypothetical protein